MKPVYVRACSTPRPIQAFRVEGWYLQSTLCCPKPDPGCVLANERRPRTPSTLKTKKRGRTWKSWNGHRCWSGWQTTTRSLAATWISSPTGERAGEEEMPVSLKTRLLFYKACVCQRMRWLTHIPPHCCPVHPDRKKALNSCEASVVSAAFCGTR